MTKPAILHVAEEMNIAAGGVPAVVRQLSRRLSAAGHVVSVAHLYGDASDLSDAATVIKYEPEGILQAWGYSHSLMQGMKASSASIAALGGVIHVHGVWKAAQTLAAKSCVVSSTPFVFTAHGMLDPWLWNQQGLAVKVKKRLFWKLLAHPVLRNSTVVHALTPMERDYLTRLLPGCKIVVIPNAIQLDTAQSASRHSRDPMFLFIGRLEPKKGVHLLLKAFAQSNLASDWSLEVVGPPWSDSYMDSLKRLVEINGLSARVNFRGPLFGDAKHQLLDRAWVMVAPSFSEGMPLVNLEAGVHRLPSITTYQTGLADWTEGGGLLINPEVDALAKALVAASSWSESEQHDRGVASRELVERRYSWDAVIPQWQALYSDLSISMTEVG